MRRLLKMNEAAGLLNDKATMMLKIAPFDAPPKTTMEEVMKRAVKMNKAAGCVDC